MNDKLRSLLIHLMHGFSWH